MLALYFMTIQGNKIMANDAKKKSILITAGHTEVPIDQVRSLILHIDDPDLKDAVTNIFKGTTGAKIASAFTEIDWETTLITSNTEPIEHVSHFFSNLKVRSYRTIDDLRNLMEEELTTNHFDVVVHSSAVSDFYVGGVFVRKPDNTIEEIDSTGKVSSKHKELFLQLLPTPKLVDFIREPWGFRGKLVKFKLEMKKTDEELLNIAAKSMHDSGADLIVANCLEWSSIYAYVIEGDQKPVRVSRDELPNELIRRLI